MRDAFTEDEMFIPMPSRWPTHAEMVNTPSLADLLIWVSMLAKDGTYVEALTRATRFHIDNIATWWKETRGGDVPTERDFPNLAPLGPVMWFEYADHTLETANRGRSGCLVTVDYERDGMAASKWRDIPVAENVRWIVRAVFFGTRFKDDPGITTSDWVYLFRLDDAGRFLNMSSFPHRRGVAGNEHVPDEAHRFAVHTEVELAFYAICFAHCRGTVIQESLPPRPVRRQLQREGKPVLRFKVLEIGPATSVLREGARQSGGSVVRALHICRGHFAQYTDEKPLFGKLTGTFYIPMHTRGSLKAGAVVKDYNVKAGVAP